MSENVLIFSLGGRERYALSVLQSREIVKLESLNHLPGANSNLLGLARVRELFVPVIDTQSILFKSKSLATPQMAIILDLDEPMALAVHAVSLVVKWDSEAQGASNAKGRFVEGVMHDEHGIIQKINPHRIIEAFRMNQPGEIEGIQNAA